MKHDNWMCIRCWHSYGCKETESIRDVSYWFKNNEDAMRTLLKGRSESNQDFEDVLISFGNNYIAGAVVCHESVSNTMYSLPDYHPGKID